MWQRPDIAHLEGHSWIIGRGPGGCDIRIRDIDTRDGREVREVRKSDS